MISALVCFEACQTCMFSRLFAVICVTVMFSNVWTNYSKETHSSAFEETAQNAWCECLFARSVHVYTWIFSQKPSLRESVRNKHERGAMKMFVSGPTVLFVLQIVQFSAPVSWLTLSSLVCGDRSGGKGVWQATASAGTKLSLRRERESLRCYHRALPSTRPKGTSMAKDK